MQIREGTPYRRNDSHTEALLTDELEKSKESKGRHDEYTKSWPNNLNMA
jgi:hypothetical protein